MRGLADVSPRVVFYDQGRGVLVVRCTHSGVDELCTALALTNHVTGTAVSVNPQTVSGLISGLTKEPLD